MSYEPPQLPLEDRTLDRVLSATTARLPDKIAIRDTQGGAITYLALDERSNQLAHGLGALGIASKEPMLVMLTDTIDFVIAWCGMAKQGVIEVPVNLAYRRKILLHICNDSRAKTILVDRKFLDRLEEIADDLEHIERCVLYSEDPAERKNLTLPPKLARRCQAIRFADLFSDDTSPVGPSPAFHDLLSIMYTSGTTGPSKGVMCTHAHAFVWTRVSMPLANLTEDDVIYTSGMPLFHAAGKWAVIYASILAGSTAILRNGFSVAHFWPDIAEHGCTVGYVMGAMANFLWQQPESPEDAKTPLERMCLIPTIPEYQAFAKRFQVEVCTAYSSTECPASSLQPLGEPLPNNRCIGHIRKGIDLAIMDEHDRELPVGEMGEFCVRPENPWEITLGYWGRPEATAKAFRNLWFHTGDAGYRDAEGRLYFVDRLTDSMRRRGENISSIEVEDEVNQHPAVLECAVFPVWDEHTEQEVMTALVTKPGETLDPEEFIRFLNKRMPYFMIPRYVDVLEELPKTPTGKIQKYPLREKGISPTTWDRVAAGLKLEK